MLILNLWKQSCLAMERIKMILKILKKLGISIVSISSILIIFLFNPPLEISLCLVGFQFIIMVYSLYNYFKGRK